jgi:hypothetical protein
MSKFMKMLNIQTMLTVPKSQNPNVQYWSRSKEDILASVKPLLLKELAFINISDEIVSNENSKTMVSTVSLICAESGEIISTSVGYCDFIKPNKFMDEAKVSGACSSYAGKNALCNLLGIDGQSDHDYVIPPKEEYVHVDNSEAKLLKEKLTTLAKGNNERQNFVSLKEKENKLTPKLINDLITKWSK